MKMPLRCHSTQALTDRCQTYQMRLRRVEHLNEQLCRLLPSAARISPAANPVLSPGGRPGRADGQASLPRAGHDQPVASVRLSYSITSLFTAHNCLSFSFCLHASHSCMLPHHTLVYPSGIPRGEGNNCFRLTLLQSLPNNEVLNTSTALSLIHSQQLVRYPHLYVEG
jgi:hypothetical protein